MSRYGASPTHLIAHVLALALAGYGLAQLLASGPVLKIALWLAAAVVLHDLVLLPLYTSLDRAGRPLGNYLRVPAGLSAVLLLAYLPGITAKGDPVLERVSGRTLDGALTAWLLITIALFATSAAVRIVRRSRARNVSG